MLRQLTIFGVLVVYGVIAIPSPSGLPTSCVCNASQDVSFTARLTKTTRLNAHQTIIYDEVLENQGGAYNAAGGIFVAPFNGRYMFSISLHTVPQNGAHIQIMKNDKEINRVYAGSSTSGWGAPGAITVFAHLQKNEIVFARVYYGEFNLYGNSWNSFQGQLIYRTQE